MADNLFFKSVVLSIFVVFLPSSIEKSLSTTAKPTTSSIALGVCQLPLRPGYCMGFFPRWYYNQKTKQCQQFVFGGCDGNNNNFLSKAACILTCHATKGLQLARIPLLITTPKPKVNTKSKESRKKIELKPKSAQPILSPSPQNKTKNAAKPCEIEKKKATDSNQSGIFVPQCDAKGNYKKMQCWKPLGLKESCWCVDKNGRKTADATTTLQGKKSCDKTSLAANSPCIKALKQSLDAAILLHGMPVSVNVFGHSHVPKCDLKTGLYTPRQCYKTKCWCVNIYTGAEIKHTYGTKGFVKCSDK